MRHRRRGVKREHSVLADFASVFERVAALPAVEGVIPGRIANNPTRHPGLVLKGETATGFKLLAKTTTSIQEVFVVVRRGQLPQARQDISALCLPRPPSRPEGDAGAMRARRPRRGGARPGAPGRGPVVPAARWQGDLVRFSTAGGAAPWLPAQAAVGEAVATPALRRLWVLRLRRTLWKRRFGVPRRTVPVPWEGARPRAGGPRGELARGRQGAGADQEAVEGGDRGHGDVGSGGQGARGGGG
jgi:hypothetical protein